MKLPIKYKFYNEIKIFINKKVGYNLSNSKNPLGLKNRELIHIK